MKWFEKRETGIKNYPIYHLTHWNGSKGYTIMVLSWDSETDTYNGWVSLLERPTIKEARQALKEWFK